MIRERAWLLALLGTTFGLLGPGQALFPASAAAIQEDACSGASWAVCDGSTQFGGDDYDSGAFGEYYGSEEDDAGDLADDAGDPVGDAWADDEDGDGAGQTQGDGTQSAASGLGLLGFGQVSPPLLPENGENVEATSPAEVDLMRRIHEEGETPRERELRLRFEKLGFSPTFNFSADIVLWCAFPRSELTEKEQEKWCFRPEDPYGISAPSSKRRGGHAARRRGKGAAPHTG
jgi:hypothetical protein